MDIFYGSGRLTDGPNYIYDKRELWTISKMARNLPRYISKIGMPVFTNGVIAKNCAKMNKIKT